MQDSNFFMNFKPFFDFIYRSCKKIDIGSITSFNLH